MLSRKWIVIWGGIGFLVGSFWLLALFSCVGGCPGNDVLFVVAFLTCPVLLLGLIPPIGLLIVLAAPIANAVTYGYAAVALTRVIKDGRAGRLHNEPH